ncbi:ATP-binding cassette domain-containing protein, partial [bacterium]|nr:ATP-binding cassette domain-containing protein [bacterium]
MAFLEIRDLTYTYPNTGVRALDGLNLDADRGELIAVIGPNAAGKSTFALLLKGLIQADSGKVRINGKEQVTSGTNPGVGILFSNPENQLVTSIVEEDVAFGLEVLGEPSEVIAQKVGTVLE